jgi:hypothetical protein
MNYMTLLLNCLEYHIRLDVEITLRTSDTPTLASPSNLSSTIQFNQGDDSNQPPAGNPFGQHALERNKAPEIYSFGRNRNRTPTVRGKLFDYSPLGTRAANNPSSRAKGKQRA